MRAALAPRPNQKQRNARRAATFRGILGGGSSPKCENRRRCPPRGRVKTRAAALGPTWRASAGR
jgi:hypothetical protein